MNVKDFSVVISTKKVPIRMLEGYENKLLTVTPEEEALGFKYCFQTKLTKETIGERIRSPIGLFETSETFIDNNAKNVIDKLTTYYCD